MLLTTRVKRLTDCVVVALDGELDMSTAPRLSEQLTALVEVGDNHLVLDLGNLRFCDSAGLAVIIQVHRALELHARRLAIAGASSTVARVLAISGLAQVIPSAANVAQAYALAVNGRVD